MTDDDLLPDLEEETESGDEDDGDGSGDLATLALDVPEPEQAMAANEALAKGGKNQHKNKGKKGAKTAGDKAGIDVVLDGEMIGLEEGASESEAEAEAERVEISAYDSDEITDPELDEIDPLMMLLGAGERPWENEKLSVVERMMMNPGYERDLDAARRNEGDPDKISDKSKDKASRVGKLAASAAGAAALGVAAAKGAQAARQDQAARQAQQQGQQDSKGAGLAGIAKGPQRTDADQTTPSGQSKADQRRANNTNQFNNTQPITYQARQNAQEVTLRRMENGLAATLDNKSNPSFDAAKAMQQKGQNGADQDQTLLDMIEIHTLGLEQGQSGGGMNWTPKDGGEDGFRQTMDMIYAALGAQSLMAVSPYRTAGWDEKRLEHKENSQDVTIAAPAPEVKSPAPELAPDRVPQINLGPGGM